MRGIAALLAVIPVAAAGLQCFMVLFLVSFPFENSDGPGLETHPEASVFLIGVAGAVLVTALGFWWFVAAAKAHRATTWFVLHALVALGLLAYWVTESEHSDGTLLGLGVGVELAGLLALLLCREDTRRRAVATGRVQDA